MTLPNDTALDVARRELPAQVDRLYRHAAALLESIDARRRHGAPKDVYEDEAAAYVRALDELATSRSYADLVGTVRQVERWLTAAKGGA